MFWEYDDYGVEVGVEDEGVGVIGVVYCEVFGFENGFLVVLDE